LVELVNAVTTNYERSAENETSGIAAARSVSGFVREGGLEPPHG